jgi:hypothetical protein
MRILTASRELGVIGSHYVGWTVATWKLIICC